MRLEVVIFNFWSAVLSTSCLSLTALSSNLNRPTGARTTYLTRNSGVLRFLAEHKNAVGRYLICGCTRFPGWERTQLCAPRIHSASFQTTTERQTKMGFLVPTRGFCLSENDGFCQSSTQVCPPLKTHGRGVNAQETSRFARFKSACRVASLPFAFAAGASQWGYGARGGLSVRSGRLRL
jgi:hypothetical protein